MPRPFFETLRELRAGHTLEELGEELANLLNAVKETRKSGSITLRIVVKPPKSGGFSYVQVTDEVTVKLPKLDKGDTVFFPTADGGLSRSDQSQRDLPFGTKPGQVVDSDTGEILSEALR
jgi:hypothetical protein